MLPSGQLREASYCMAANDRLQAVLAACWLILDELMRLLPLILAPSMLLEDYPSVPRPQDVLRVAFAVYHKCHDLLRIGALSLTYRISHSKSAWRYTSAGSCIADLTYVQRSCLASVGHIQRNKNHRRCATGRLGQTDTRRTTSQL